MNDNLKYCCVERHVWNAYSESLNVINNPDSCADAWTLTVWWQVRPHERIASLKLSSPVIQNHHFFSASSNSDTYRKYWWFIGEWLWWVTTYLRMIQLNICSLCEDQWAVFKVSKVDYICVFLNACLERTEGGIAMTFRRDIYLWFYYDFSLSNRRLTGLEQNVRQQSV